MKVTCTDIDTINVELSFTEAIGLYKMGLAVNHPGDSWVSPEQLQHDEDVGPLSAAIVVQLRDVVGP